jgi:DNA-binding GntR family transcriptional regulator
MIYDYRKSGFAHARTYESELVGAYEVARTTVRRAVGVLRDEGLVYTVPQRGTYAAKNSGDSTERSAKR